MSVEAQIHVNNYSPQEIGDGYTAEIISLENYRQKAKGTARHETHHAIVDPNNVKLVSIHPGPGYLGKTELYEFDEVAAAAPAEAGDSGIDWDEQLTTHIHKKDWNVSKSSAGARIAVIQEEIDEVSATLEEKGEMSGFEVKEAMARAGRRRAKIKITSREGNVTYLSSETNKRSGYQVTLGIEKSPAPINAEIFPFASRVRLITEMQIPAIAQRVRVLSKVA